MPSVRRKMIKAITSWILVIVGCLILLGTVSFIGSQVVRNIQSRKTALFGWSPFRMPDFMGFSVGERTFFTDAWALLLAQIGIAILLIAVGLHFRHLHRQKIGRRILEQQSTDKAEPRSSA
ncbi:MAG: hypothetical protein PCFJNLEI_03904 [Verrucomicrobiae bacterium]|nr:hypothetical protein [Verrucomicrobiae bacterium]